MRWYIRFEICDMNVNGLPKIFVAFFFRGRFVHVCVCVCLLRMQINW